MKKVTITTLILSLFYSLSAQEDSTKLLSDKEDKKIKIYKTWISLNNESRILKGALYEIKDSSIFVSSSLSKQDYSTGNFQKSKIYYNNIDIIKTRQKHSVGKRTCIGAIAGFVIGGMIGFLSGDDNPDEVYFASTASQKAKEDAIILAIGGAGIGALCGLIKIKIPINGNLENFKRNTSKLKKFSIR